MVCQNNYYSSMKWILFICLLLSSDQALGQLIAPDVQFIADFVASSPGFADSFNGKDICSITDHFGCISGHLTKILLSQTLGGSIPDSIGSLPKLVKILMPRASLSGTLPASLANLLNLTDLDLSDNQLAGTISAGMFKLEHLETLDLNSNRLSGTLPDAYLPAATLIQLYDNRLSGTIPPSLFQLPLLTNLGLSTNSLTGTIPELNMPAVKFLQLDSNSLTGTLPSSLLTSQSLIAIGLSANELTGTLPAEFATTKVPTIALRDNQFSGSIPDLTNNQMRDLNLGSNFFTGTFPLITSTSLVDISVNNNGLYGTIPYNALNCPQLTILDVSNNKLSGPLPSFKNSTALFQLDLSLNRFTGQLDELSPLTSLQEIYLSSNLFTGEFVPNPAWSGIFDISIRSNKFTGSFPDFSFGVTSSLTSIDISFNQFDGTIPAERLDPLITLKTLNAQGNRFSGTFPDFSKTSIRSIDLSNNNLLGTLPESVGKLLHLTDLNVANNQLEGTIPDIFDSISSLFTLNLEFNKFTGTLPPSFNSLAFLSSVILTSNSLTGTIPSTIGELQSLQVMKLGSNNFEGTIPEEVGQLPSLTQLALENNMFTGTIPTSIFSLRSLSSLTLQNNNLTGTVSSSINSIAVLKQLNLANNNLLGFFEPTMSLIECNVAGNDFCCGENLSSACQTSAPCSGTRKVVAQNETITSSQQYQALDVPAGVVLLVDSSTAIQTQCLSVNGDIQLLVSNPSQQDSSNFVTITYSYALTDLHNGDLKVVEDEKCKDFAAQVANTPATDSARGYLTVSLTTTTIDGCSDLSQATIYAIAFSLGIGVPLIVALIVVIVLWRKGRFRRTIRQQVSMDIMNSLADKSFLTPSTSLKVDRELGAGSFGKVYVGKWQQTQVAFKFCNVPSKMDEFLREAALMMKLTPHPNVVQLLAISIDGPEPVIVLEYCDGGSLDNLLFDSTDPISDVDKIRIASGIARGMLHLHRNNIVHRDLAARNVLLQKGTPKVSDFGMSRLLQVNQESKTYSNVGPIRWMAPESLRDRINTPKSDVWMYGIVLTEIITQSEPHTNEDMFAIGAKIRDQGVTPALPSQVHPLLQQLVTMCLKMNPDDRPDFESLCQHIDQYCNTNRISI